MDILSVGNRRDLRRFIDYAYERNRPDPHWIPPLRIAERERSRRRRIRSSPSEVEPLLAFATPRVAPHRGDRDASASNGRR